jgi:hypothetical protein
MIEQILSKKLVFISVDLPDKEKKEIEDFIRFKCEKSEQEKPILIVDISKNSTAFEDLLLEKVKINDSRQSFLKFTQNPENLESLKNQIKILKDNISGSNVGQEFTLKNAHDQAKIPYSNLKKVIWFLEGCGFVEKRIEQKTEFFRFIDTRSLLKKFVDYNVEKLKLDIDYFKSLLDFEIKEIKPKKQKTVKKEK